MEIRTLGPDDAAAYWKLREEALEREPFAFGMAVEDHRATTLEQTAWRLHQLPENSFTLGCFENDRMVGTATFVRSPGLKERHKGHIYGVYVTGSHRRNGLGRKLIAALLSKAQEDTSLEQVLLAVTTCQKSRMPPVRPIWIRDLWHGTESFKGWLKIRRRTPHDLEDSLRRS